MPTPGFDSAPRHRQRRGRIRLSRLLVALVLGAVLSGWQTTAMHDQSQPPVPAQALAAAVNAAGDGQGSKQDNLPVRAAFAVPATLQTSAPGVAPATATVPAAPPPLRGAAQGAPAGASWGSTGFPRGAYSDSSASFSGIARAGFNAIMGSHYRGELDAVTTLGLKAVVWLGSWSNKSCSFNWNDSQVQSAITPVAGHPAILAYYLGDEPLFSACPNAPQVFATRTALVHSLDPGRPTFTVVQAWDAGGRESFPYGHFARSVDILGLDVYPCARSKAACNFAEIDSAVAAADAAGISNYWAILQAFEDDYYRMPTPDEIAAQFEHWRRSRMSGYFVFSWDYLGSKLDGRPDLVAQLARSNGR
jgi:hypothetical protein